MSGDLLIVARNQRALYEYLKNDFADDPEVVVVMDRRQGERRQRAETWTAERRRASDRRGQPPIADKLESIGFAIVRTD